MTLEQAILSGFRKYIVFSGRASRSEYWYWTLFALILSLFAMALDSAVLHRPLLDPKVFHPLKTVASLVTFLPGLSVLFRRLHDVNRSGWWILGLFILMFIVLAGLGMIGMNRASGSAPTVGPLEIVVMLLSLAMFAYAVTMLVWQCTRGTLGPNRYGSDPLETDR